MNRRRFIQSLGITCTAPWIAQVALASTVSQPPVTRIPLERFNQLIGPLAFLEMRRHDEIRVELAPNAYMPDGIKFYWRDEGLAFSPSSEIVAPLIRAGNTVRGEIITLTQLPPGNHGVELGRIELLVWMEQ